MNIFIQLKNRFNNLSVFIWGGAILAVILAGETNTQAADRDFRPKTVIRRPFPAITKFPVVAAKNVGGRINDAELVLGVTVGKESRAYPINMLTGPRREILNDTLGGKAIAATW
ncbi:MAG: hypothetical protein Tsb009_23150 [Planctomycetaceae bacterium]